ncbi:MAG: alpha/beta fold hydrolase [Caldilineaceae bacterium]
MAVEIVMPKWGLSMQQGRINQWLKAEGATVKEGEELVEIESDKITNVVEAPASGILARIVHAAGSVVPITEIIAWITAPGEAIPALPGNGKSSTIATSAPAPSPVAASAPTPASSPSDGERIRAMPVARRIAQEHNLDLATVQGTGPNGTITKQDVEKALAARAAAPQPSKVRAMPVARTLAKEKGLDLAQIRGTGPEGVITKQDVEKALVARPASVPAAPTPPPLQKVTFYSAGQKLSGLLYSPPNLAAGEKRAGVVLCVGYTYLKTLVMPDIAKALNAAGYVGLVFDYRGFGDSEGARWRLLPNEQVEDVRAALTFLADQPHVNAERLAVIGLSLGGAHAITAAALDERVDAVVALEAPSNGQRWLRSLRRYSEWQEFQARVAADRVQRVRTGQSTMVDPLEIVLPDPGSRTFLEAVIREFPQMKCEVPLETADALLEYNPEALAARIAPRPLLIVHGENDLLVPVDEARQLYQHAGEPCRLEIMPGLDHFNWVMPNQPGFRQVTGLIVTFLQEHLPA